MNIDCDNNFYRYQYAWYDDLFEDGSLKSPSIILILFALSPHYLDLPFYPSRYFLPYTCHSEEISHFLDLSIHLLDIISSRQLQVILDY